MRTGRTHAKDGAAAPCVGPASNCFAPAGSRSSWKMAGFRRRASGREDRRSPWKAWVSAAQAKSLDQLLVTPGILALEIVEQAATLADHDQQAAPRVKVLIVGLQMVGQVLDALAQDRDLHFRRARIARL